MLYHTKNPHGGDTYGTEITLDFSVNLNPFGTPPSVIETIKAVSNQVENYPDTYCRGLIAAIAAYEAAGVRQEQIFCGAGAAELIYRFCGTLRPKRAAAAAPTFSEYGSAAAFFGAEVVRHLLTAENDFAIDRSILRFLEEQKPDVLFLCTPNNPTGQTVPRALLKDILALCSTQGTRVLLDECFLDFTEAESATDLLELYPNLLILKAFTKNFALAGVRIGYCLTADESVLERMAAAGQPWDVSTLAQAAGIAAARERGWVTRAKACISKERGVLTEGLRALGFYVCPSEANFLLFRAPVGLDAALRREKIAIRSCAMDAGLGEGWYRTAVRLPEENRKLLAAIRNVMEDRTWH